MICVFYINQFECVNILLFFFLFIYLYKLCLVEKVYKLQPHV